MERSQFAVFYNLILSDANIFLLGSVDLTSVATADLLAFYLLFSQQRMAGCQPTVVKLEEHN